MIHMEETREALLTELTSATTPRELLLTEAKFAAVDRHQER